jgi:hypothetical protein
LKPGEFGNYFKSLNIEAGVAEDVFSVMDKNSDSTISKEGKSFPLFKGMIKLEQEARKKTAIKQKTPAYCRGLLSVEEKG